MAWYFDCPGGDSLKIANPTGIDVNAAFTLLLVARPLSNAGGAGRTLVRVGNATGSTESRGFTFSHNASDKAYFRIPGAAFHQHATTLVMNDEFYRFGVHSASSGIGHRGITVNGSKSTENMDAIPGLSGGDELSIAYGLGGPGWSAPDLEVAMLGWLQSVDLSGAAVDSYCNDPCALIDDYGPGGVVVADALKKLVLGDLTVDLSGVANHPTIVDGSTVSGPTDYPVACTAPAAALTGTALDTIDEAEIVAGGKTLIITLTDATWIA